MFFQTAISISTFCGFYFYSPPSPEWFARNTILSDSAYDIFCKYSFFLYCAILFIRFLKVSYQYKIQRGLPGKELLAAPFFLKNLTKDLQKKLLIAKPVVCWCSENITTPIVTGIVKPVIIFPLAAINNLSPAETETLLLHELSHIKNKDQLLNLVLIFLEIVFFFNPFSWNILKEIRTEMEKACDAKVLNLGADKIIYASALYKVANPNSQSTFSLAAAGDRKLLLQRIRFFTGEVAPEKNAPSRSKIMLTVYFVFFAFLAFYFSNREISVTDLTKGKNEITFASPSKNNVTTTLESNKTISNNLIEVSPKTELPVKNAPLKVSANTETRKKNITKSETEEKSSLPVMNVSFTNQEDNNTRIIYLEEENSNGKKTLTMITVKKENGNIKVAPILKVESVNNYNDTLLINADSAPHKVFIYH